jgi:hypothetical protein
MDKEVLNKLSTIQTEFLDSLIKFADEHDVSRDKIVEATAFVFMELSMIGNFKNYVGEEEGAKNE